DVLFAAGARVAARLGATTSGHVLVYGADGALLFSGGITSARAHEGDSIGQNAIVRALYGGKPPIDQTPVFGCGLKSPAVRGGVTSDESLNRTPCSSRPTACT